MVMLDEEGLGSRLIAPQDNPGSWSRDGGEPAAEPLSSHLDRRRPARLASEASDAERGADPPAEVVARLLSAKAPRYTSYPTAVQFTADIGPDRHHRWLGAVPAGHPVSLYVHVPFCRRLCWYCGCSMKVSRRPEPIAQYAEDLEREIALVANALGRRPRVGALHFGGGSPDSLPVERLDRLFTVLRRAFALEPEAEIAAELDPSFVTRDWIFEATRQGLNRASVGVQTLAEPVQRAIHRPLAFERLTDVVASLRGAGIGAINMDLMYGLPHQRTADVLDTLERVLPLAPDRLAVFGYAHVPALRRHQTIFAPDSLPGAEARLEQAALAAERLQAAGYQRIGLDHFALPTDDLARAHASGAMRRNFQGYTTDQADTLIGLGVSAISRLPEGFAQNTADLAAWRAALIEDRLPTARGVAFRPDDRLRGELIERLMCDGSANLSALLVRFSPSPEVRDELSRATDLLERAGLVSVAEGRLVITEMGAPFVRSICAAFDVDFDPDSGRHSRAI